MSERQSNIQWQVVIELSIILFTILGTTIPLYLHTDAKIEGYEARTQAILEGMRQDIKLVHEEMKDFHGRLCAIEERNRK